jgi:tellurite resistance protein TerC
MIRENGKRLYTSLFVVMMLASIDLIFTLDSIPAVMGISRDLVVILPPIFLLYWTSFAVLLLRGAVSKFDYLQQGISIVLVFIGIKMLGEWIDQWFEKSAQSFISLFFITVCMAGSIVYSIFIRRRGAADWPPPTPLKEATDPLKGGNDPA